MLVLEGEHMAGVGRSLEGTQYSVVIPTIITIKTIIIINAPATGELEKKSQNNIDLYGSFSTAFACLGFVLVDTIFPLFFRDSTKLVQKVLCLFWNSPGDSFQLPSLTSFPPDCHSSTAPAFKAIPLKQISK